MDELRRDKEIYLAAIDNTVHSLELPARPTAEVLAVVAEIHLRTAHAQAKDSDATPQN